MIERTMSKVKLSDLLCMGVVAFPLLALIILTVSIQKIYWYRQNASWHGYRAINI